MKKAALILGVCFFVAAVLTPLATTVVTFLLPEEFASSAKISSPPAAMPLITATLGKITSRASLDRVITNLNLGAQWGRKYKHDGELPALKCYELLRDMTVIILQGGVPVVEIKISSDDRDEAAAIANELASVFISTTPGASLVVPAEPSPKPARPRKRFNILIGLSVGAACAVNGIVLLFVARKRKPGAVPT